MSLPTVFTPEEVASHFGWSPRKLREEARKLGTCSILGNRMVLTNQDVASLLEALRPEEPKFSPSPRGDFAALVKVRDRQANEAREAKAKAKLAKQK